MYVRTYVCMYVCMNTDDLIYALRSVYSMYVTYTYMKTELYLLNQCSQVAVISLLIYCIFVRTYELYASIFACSVCIFIPSQVFMYFPLQFCVIQAPPSLF